MRKMLIGFAVLAVLAAGGFFGLQFYLQQNIEREVSAALQAIRDGGNQASHGEVTFDLLSRTVTVPEIVVQSSAQPPVTVKIGRFTAAGVALPQNGRFAADRIVIANVEAGGTMPMMGGVEMAYKSPRIELINYSGPAGPLRQLDPTSLVDVWRFALEHFAAINATTISIPSVTAAVKPLSGDLKNQVASEYGYSDVLVRDVREGRIASTTIERTTFSSKVSTPSGADLLRGEITKIEALDIDAAATLAMLDPSKAKDDNYYRAYRKVSVGAYAATMPKGMRVQIDGMSSSDIGLRPSRLQVNDILAVTASLPPPGTQPSPRVVQEMLGRMANLYEGIRIGDFEMHGLSIEMPDGTAELGSLQLTKLENGRIGEFALNGLDVRGPRGPVKLARFALRSLDVANLLRVATRFAATPGQQPTPEQLAALLPLLEGAEIKGLVAPLKDTGRPVSIDTLGVSWGQFIGSIPTKARMTLNLSGPTETNDIELFKALAAAGQTWAKVNLDLGAGWSESSRVLAFDPFTLEIGGMFQTSARLELANVPKEAFSTDLLQIMLAAALVEAGPVALVVRDTGGVDLLLAQKARTERMTVEAARRATIDGIRQNAMTMSLLNPDVMPIAGALTRFIENSRGTLTIKLTPKGKVPLAQLLETTKTNPIAALARFQVEATNGR